MIHLNHTSNYLTIIDLFMSFFHLHKRNAIVLSIIGIAVLFFVVCINNQAVEIEPVIALPGGNRLTGSAACRNCHASSYNSYIHTAHYSTSKPAFKKNIKGSFENDKNSYVFSAYDQVMMAEMDSGLYQINFKNRQLDKSYRFDMVIGSGTRGQTYLHWEGNRLFQLPISYYTLLDTWSNSPGFPDGRALFTRPISGECMGCHSSFMKKISSEIKSYDAFDRNQIVYGVNCERCHGPGGKHVDFQTSHPEEKNARYIINAQHLSQRQQLDACAICHSSIKKDMTTALGFTTGDTIRHTTNLFDTSATLDVHGNQYGLLVASKCFRLSGDKITCSTCHNTHENERGNLAVFSQRCMSCHNPDKANFCTMASSLGKAAIIGNCIDCHMPNKPSQVLNVKTQDEDAHKPAVIRSHFISIYPSESKKIIQLMHSVAQHTGANTVSTKK